ncbi:10488_t:CDS:2 [Ambispora leptoticha]|uniref:10488_t:CDS:1 n=1 Tax=Ambispora leptoticha TaxID=144679 RepID=A0A9N9G7G8_9GLOM|nr:10488_t:CDS:2 [Ambispora leptoticha]
MDPYRPTPPYAPYRPQQYVPPAGGPPNVQGYGQPPRPAYMPGVPTQRPNYMNPAQRPPFGAMPMSGAQPMLGQAEAEKLTTLFIGGISPGVTDDWMEKILKTCGNLKSWKRVKDQAKPKGFGFAEYMDADSVLRALRVLGGEGSGDDKKDKGVILPALEEGAVGKKLIVKVDDNTRKFLDQYEVSRPRTVHDTELDKNALLAVIDVVEEMTKPPPEQNTSPTASSHPDNKSLAPSSPRPENVERDEETDLPADLPPEQKDLIYREIAFFRERAAQRERERQKEEEERASRRTRAEQARQERSRASETRERERSFGHYHQSANFAPSRDERRESMPYDDEEEERRRRAKREKELEMAFKEVFQAREATVARGYEREDQREIDQREKEIRDRELAARKFAEWDDDLEAERGVEEYYRDRTRWWHHRQQFRARELAQDEQDRIHEEQEIEAEKRRQEWEKMLEEEKKQRTEAEASESNGKTAAILTTHPPSNGDVQIGNNGKSKKLTLNISNKRRTTLIAPAEEGEDSDDEETDAKKKKRVLVPLEYSDDDDDEKKTEDRKRKITDLVATIPTDKEGLWNWNVKWEELDEQILSQKLQPFISKKIVGYLGVQEDELVYFVMDHLRNKKSAIELTKEMEQTLDEESELFVMKLWRMLIYETESKARKIQ